MPVQEMRENSFVIRKRNVINAVLTAAIATAVCLLDQITKSAVVGKLALGESVEAIPGVLNWTYIQNRGMAMGMLANHRWVFMVMSVVMIAAIVLYVVFSKKAKRLTVCVLAAILGGGVGNMIDRFAYGYVVDFIDVRILPQVWKWIFNVADIFVTLGAITLGVVFIVGEVKARKAAKAGKAEEKDGTQPPESTDDL